MSNAAGAPSNGATKTGLKSPDSKGKGKGANVSPDVSMGDDNEEEEEEEEEAEETYDDDMDDGIEEEEEEEEEDTFEEIDPSQIVGRRTRGVKVDYTSKEALEKAGLKPENEGEDGDEDEDANMD